MRTVTKAISSILIVLLLVAMLPLQAEAEALVKRSPLTNVFSTGSFHSVYVRADGTVAGFGRDFTGRLDVSDWENVAAVSAESHTVGLLSDGTCVATGPDTYGQCGVFFGMILLRYQLENGTRLD